MDRRPRLLVGSVLLLAVAQCLYWLIAGAVTWELREFLTEGQAAIVAERTRNAYLLLAWTIVNAAAVLAFAWRRRTWGVPCMAAVQAGNLAYGLWWSVPMALSIGEVESADWVFLQPVAALVILVLLAGSRRIREVVIKQHPDG